MRIAFAIFAITASASPIASGAKPMKTSGTSPRDALEQRLEQLQEQKTEQLRELKSHANLLSIDANIKGAAWEPLTNVSKSSGGKPGLNHPKSLSKDKNIKRAASTKPLANVNKSKLSLIETWSDDTDTPPSTGVAEAKDDVQGDIDVATESPPPEPSKFLASSRSVPTESHPALESLAAAMKASPTQNTAQSRALTTASMEAAVMELMSGKGAFAGTPMGGSVQKIVDILEKTMKPKVKDAHDADQDNLNQLNKEHGKCFDAKDKALLAATLA